MKLSDLLETVRYDPPAARWTVDDIVASGRRRRRHRNAGWAIAAVVAVAIAIGVPQILTRQQAHPVNPTPTATRALERLFKTYQVNDLTVGDPEWVALNNQTTYIGRDRPPGRPLRAVGMLDVYRAGFDPPPSWDPASVTAAAPIGGRRAFFAKPRAGAGDTIWKPVRMLVWEYAENAFAVVTAYDRYLGLSVTEMREVAVGFALQPVPQAIRQAYTVGWIPPGLRLAAVEYQMRGTGSAVFVPQAVSAGFVTTALDTQTRGWLSNLDTDNELLGVDTPVPPGGMVIDFRWGSSSEAPRAPRCGPKTHPEDLPAARSSWTRECSVSLDDPDQVRVGDPVGTGPTPRYLIFRAGDAVPLDQMQRAAAASASTGNMRHASSWQPSTVAFPASAQLPRD